MGHVTFKEGRKAKLAAEIADAVAGFQPWLTVEDFDDGFRISGDFFLTGPEGPFDHFQIDILVGLEYPAFSPFVFETGGRIPRKIDRHIYEDPGCCCLNVWEEWLITATDHSFRGFLEGPVHTYFLNQWFFEKDGTWRFGDRAHGIEGVITAYAEALRIGNNLAEVRRYLRVLSQEWPKGHQLCPCGSGQKLRHCHHQEIGALHQQVTPYLAQRMLQRLKVLEETNQKALGR